LASCQDQPEQLNLTMAIVSKTIVFVCSDSIIHCNLMIRNTQAPVL
jgi:hypothetical protein